MWAYVLSLLGTLAHASPTLPGEALQAPPDTVVVHVEHSNDNKLYNFWETLTGVDGDDFGYTHDLLVRVESRDLGPAWMRWSLEGRTALYTERLGYGGLDPTDRGAFSNQRFMNDNRVQLGWEHLAAPSSPLPWLTARVAVGMQELNGETIGGLFQGSGHQRAIHDALNDIRPLLAAVNPRFIGVPGHRWHGATLTLTGGPVVDMVFGQNHWRARGWVVGHLDASTLRNVTYGGVATGTSLYWQHHDSTEAFGVALNMSGHVDIHGTHDVAPVAAQITGRWSIELGVRYAVLGAEVTGFGGALRNHARYNLRNRISGNIDWHTVLYLRFGIPTKKAVRPARRMPRWD